MAIPKQMQSVYDEIAGMIEEYCEKYLSEDYQALCLRLLEKLCRKRPSPLLKGRRNTWAAGIVYAIGSNNFIFDKSVPIHRTADELSRPFGIAPSTAGNKAAEIRRMISMSPWDTEWILPEFIDQNPAVWMLSVDGFIVDARDLPLELQQEAARRGLIPYVPAPKQETRKEQPTLPAEKAANEAPDDSETAEDSIPLRSSDVPSTLDDFSDIYDRFRTV